MNKVGWQEGCVTFGPRKLRALMLTLLWSFTLAHAQSQKPDLKHYADLARQAVADKLKAEGRSLEPLSVELVGEVVFPPDHASLHRPRVPTAPVLAGEALRPLALVAVQNGQPPLGYWLVTFLPDVLDVSRVECPIEGEVIPQDLPEDSAFLSLPAPQRSQLMEKLAMPVFTASEREQVARELAPFWEAWVDISRGPERLMPFLGDEIKCVFYYSGEPVKVPTDARSFATGILDIAAFRAWNLIEGISDYPEYPFAGIFSGEPDEAIRSAAERHILIRKKFSDAGLFDAQHQATVRPYLGILLREGAILKFPAAALRLIELEGDHTEAAGSCNNPRTVEQRTACLVSLLDLLPTGAHYVVFVHQEGMILFFTRQGPSIRLVGISSAAG